MDHYERVVIDYLRADRTVFVNTECCIQVNQAPNPDKSGPHWYCDAVAIDFRRKSILLCEISYSLQLYDLGKRLQEWNEHWLDIGAALRRDSFLPDGWPIRPWVFIPQQCIAVLLKRWEEIESKHGSQNFLPLVTTLEMVQPWCYRSWDRIGEKPKPDLIPVAMRS